MLSTRERSSLKSDLNSPESAVTLRDWLVFQHSHAGLEPEFLLVLGQTQIILQVHWR